MSHSTEIRLSRANGEPQFTVVDMIKIMWSRRITILAVTMLSGALAWGIAKLQPKEFEANVLVAPVGQNNGGSALTSMLHEFSGLASLTGISAAQDIHTAIEIATLKSNALAETYIRKNNLLPILFAKKWNASLKKWKSVDSAPTLWDGSQYFLHAVLDLQSTRKSGLVSLKITWTNPTLAAQWANGLVALANSTLRQRAIDQAMRDLNYLRDQAKITHNIDLKRAIDTLMLHALQNAMVAQGEQEYAFRVVDPAVAPEKPSSPKTVLWILAGLVLGFSLSTGYSLLQSSWNSQNLVAMDSVQAFGSQNESSITDGHDLQES